jgi:hypothetical protein
MSAIPICYTTDGRMWHAYPDRHTPAQMVTMIYAAIDLGYTITRAAAAVLAKHG